MTEDIGTLQSLVKHLERENKLLRQTLLDDFAKAALIGNTSSMCLKPADTAGIAFDYAEAMMAERERRYGKS